MVHPNTRRPLLFIRLPPHLRLKVTQPMSHIPLLRACCASSYACLCPCAQLILYLTIIFKFMVMVFIEGEGGWAGACVNTYINKLLILLYSFTQRQIQFDVLNIIAHYIPCMNFIILILVNRSPLCMHHIIITYKVIAWSRACALRDVMFAECVRLCNIFNWVYGRPWTLLI